MNRDAVLHVLRENRPNLEARGVRRAAVFGSVARGEATPQSDIDVLVDLDYSMIRTLYDYVGVQNLIGDLFSTKVDVISRKSLRPSARPSVERDAVYAF